MDLEKLKFVLNQTLAQPPENSNESGAALANTVVKLQ